MSTEGVLIILELLKCKKHRSPFRAGMEKKARRWLAGPSVSHPFSIKELDWLKPKWPVRIALPT